MFDPDRGAGGTGAIMRDEVGFFVAASCSDIPFVEDAATAESRGLRDGFLLANEVGCNKICVEADCMEVVEIMQGGGNSLGRATAIYEEYSFLATNFISILFSHCPRKANVVADLLARNSRPLEPLFGKSEPTGFLVDVLTNDVSIFAHEI